MLFMLCADASPGNRNDASPIPAAASPRRLGRVAAFLAAALAFAPATLRAETGSPLPQGYTTDIPNAPAAPPAPGAPATTPVQDVEEAADVDEFADDDPSALTDFHEPLDPYGAWVEDSNYGTVWVPSTTVVGADFAPYQTGGHWTVADSGDWMWVSDYDWGYIPFHYGRWVWIGGRGWAWIPGRTYAPAWVVWRVGDGGYLGWAPMPPSWYWSGGVAVNLWTTPVAAFCFVPTTYVFHHHVHTYVVRDPVVVRQVAAATHTYHAARPTSGGGGGHGAVGGARGGYRPASPSFREAGIPSSAAPKSFSKPDPRARAFATKSSTASVRRGANLPASPGGSPRGFVDHTGSSRPSRGDALPSRSGGSHAQRSPFSADSPVRRGMPSSTPSGDAGRAPTFQGSRPSGRADSAPTFHAPSPRPSGRADSAPTFHAPSPRPSVSSPRPSAPAVHPPSVSRPSAPTFHAPSVSRPSAPTFHAPSPSRSSSSPKSAPSHSGGGRSGGGRGGGRGR